MNIPRAVETVGARGTSLRWAVQRPMDSQGTRAARLHVCRARGAFVPRDVEGPIDARLTSIAPLVSPSARGRNVRRALRRASAALGRGRARGSNGPRALGTASAALGNASARGRDVSRQIATASVALGNTSARRTNVPREIGTPSARGMSVRREIGSSWLTRDRKREYFPSRVDRLGSARDAGRRRSYAPRAPRGWRSMGRTATTASRSYSST